MRIYTLPFILTTLCLSGGALAQPTHRVVRLSPPEAYRPSETAIAINPVNPDNLIGTSIQYNKQGGARVNGHAYVTSDGGKTWRDVALVDPRNLSQGDDSITFDATGRAFHAYMSFDGIRVPNPPRAYSGIYVVSTSDGGQTWSAPVPVIDHVNSVIPFEDKPWPVTDNAVASPYKNRVYLAWTRFDVYGSKNPEHKSHIMFAASHDGGVSFRPVSKISDESGDALDGDGTLEGAITAVGLKGEVYVIWSGPKGLVMDKSMDGGVTFGKDKIIGAHPGGWDMEIPGVNRSNGMPVTRIDHSAGPNRGAIYVNWIDDRHGDPDVFVMASRDGGETWSAPVRVNDDKRGNGKAQFLTWMAVDPVDGAINLIFHDRRDQEGTKTALTLARSVDNGKTFVNYKIDMAPFACNPAIFFGDYNGIDAVGGRVAAIFTHFIRPDETGVSAALFRFKPGTQQILPVE